MAQLSIAASRVTRFCLGLSCRQGTNIVSVTIPFPAFGEKWVRCVVLSRSKTVVKTENRNHPVNKPLTNCVKQKYINGNTYVFIKVKYRSGVGSSGPWL